MKVKETPLRTPKWVYKSSHFLPRINGRRGAFQLLFGVVFACLMVLALIAKDFSPALVWIPKWLSQEGILITPGALAPIWGIPAIAAVLGAFLPRPKDWFSFALLTFAPSMYGCLFILGGLVSPQGTSIAGAIIYWALAGSVMVVSGMTGDHDRDDRKTKL